MLCFCHLTTIKQSCMLYMRQQGKTTSDQLVSLNIRRYGCNNVHIQSSVNQPHICARWQTFAHKISNTGNLSEEETTGLLENYRGHVSKVKHQCLLLENVCFCKNLFYNDYWTEIGRSVPFINYTLDFLQKLEFPK